MNTAEQIIRRHELKTIKAHAKRVGSDLRMPNNQDMLDLSNKAYLWSTSVAALFGAVAIVSAFLIFTYSKRVSREQDLVIANLRNDTAHANQKAEELRTALDKEVAARQPRHLTPDQVTRFAGELVNAPKDAVIVKPNFVDSEAEAFAAQIDKAFLQAGIQAADRPLSIISIQEPGIHLAIKNREAIPVQADFIMKAFDAAGIPVTAHIADFVPDEQVVVVLVGRRF